MAAVNQHPVLDVTTVYYEAGDDVTKMALFGWNISYLTEWRGKLNILSVIFGIIILYLIAKTCALALIGQPSYGIACRHPDMYLMLISCYSFIAGTLQLVSCFASQKTSIIMLRSFYEFFSYLLSLVMYLTASISLIVIVPKRDMLSKVEHAYELTIAAAALGLVNTCLYGVSAVLFFIRNRELITRVPRR